MTSRDVFNAFPRLKALPPLPLGSLDIPEPTSMEKGDVVLQKLPTTKSIWSTDAPDIFILLCSLLLTAISMVFVAFVTSRAIQGSSNDQTLLVLQRVISSLSVTITSAIIMVAGKRYVFFKLMREGLRSRRVALYSNPSIGAIVSYFALHGAELPLLGLSVVWVLGLVTSLTVHSSYVPGSISMSAGFIPPSGPLNAVIQDSSSESWVTLASALLSTVEWSACLGPETWFRSGLVNITSTNVTTGHPSAIIYYPPLVMVHSQSFSGTDLSFPTTMNGFDFSMESLSSVPSAAQNLSCGSSDVDLWFGGSDNQTLSIIAAQSPFTSNAQGFTNIFRFNATAIIVGGTLSYTFPNDFQFSRNGTSWPNIMSKDSQWARDITSLICNATIPPIHDSSCAIARTVPLINFAATLNNKPFLDGVTFYSALSMALGAYSSAMYKRVGNSVMILGAKWYLNEIKVQYGIYILILQIVASLIMLIITVVLRLASPLGADFIDSTRLLLDPLKKPELFNASLETTLNALGDPYIMVSGNELLITERKAMKE